MHLFLGTIGPDVRATAETDGWWLRPSPASGADLRSRVTWPAATIASTEGRAAALQVEMLLDLELAESIDGAVVVRWDRFADLLAQDIQLPLRWSEWSPLMLAIDRVSELQRPDFRYDYSYRFGARETQVEQVGYFLRRPATDQLFHLDEQTYALVDAMDRFNATPEPERTKAAVWLAFAEVKGCSIAVGAALDDYLASNDVVVPAQIALDVLVHEDDSISFVPKIPSVPGVAEGEFREAFLRQADAHGLYTLDGEGGKRVRVVLSDRHRQVLERMKQVRRARGAEKEDARQNPARYFEGLLDAVEIEYGPRVIGVGAFPFAQLPHDPSDGGGFFKDVPAPDEAEASDNQPKEYKERATQIRLPGPSGSGDVVIKFQDSSELNDACAAMAIALAEGRERVAINGVEVEVTPASLVALQRPPDSGDSKRQMYLLVYTNEEDLRVNDEAAVTRSSSLPASVPAEPRLPANLRAGVSLKPHQQEALRWLQLCEAIPERRGVLLADDMGLGKTLQILSFLAWRIEQGRLRAEEGSDGPPWRPILIVAPLILVENETWVTEMRRFFAHEGDLFKPTLVLHGPGIDDVRVAGPSGAETVVGRPQLDPDKLMQYRTVITNYETVVNYQHSLAQKKNGRVLWSAIVTDEAQKYKVLNTKVSHALRAISGDFHIASTGTPVENRLLDLWNIMDVVQPAVLGDAKQFSQAYEQLRGTEEATAALDELRQRLLYRAPHAYVIRRTKAELVDLPPKAEVRLVCDMTNGERELHIELLSALSKERKKGRHLSVLHRLAQLYQHPALVSGGWEDRTSQELISESSKLQMVMTQLHRICAAGEKVIIFARHLEVQRLLAQVIGEEFRIQVDVINGSTSRGKGYSSSTSSTARAKNERKRMLDQFRTAPGFGAIVLSPFVAGIGLTIVEANHVIHYGRWWNPAVENQATDRAYRIGQTKEVSVYLPILRDASGKIADTFDECLDRLLTKKAGLANDFLHPSDAEDLNAAELCELLEGQATGGMDVDSNAPFTSADLDQLSPLDFEAAVAALYQARGYRVVLTPKGGDAGADVLAYRPDGSYLVQTKHSATGLPSDERALSDVIGACDIYGNRLGGRWKPIVVSNAPMTPGAIREAHTLGIELIPGDRLASMFVESKVGHGAMVACAADRCANFEEAVRQARSFLNATSAA